MAAYSSLSEASPEIPTAPITSPLSFSASTPPGTGMKRPSDAAAIARLKRRAILQPVADGAAGDAHAERARRLADGDVGAEIARAVLALEQHDVAADVEHRDGERQQSRVGAGFQRAVDDLSPPSRAAC